MTLCGMTAICVPESMTVSIGRPSLVLTIMCIGPAAFCQMDSEGTERTEDAV